MGVIDGNIVSAPLNTRDVGSVLGSSSNDVGTLCTHANINMWAKFKPVPLRAIFPEDTLKGSSDWNGNPQSSSHKPWWYGDGDQPAYTVPVISELADMGSNGNQNSDAVWRYNRPTGKGASAAYPDFPFRLTDFVGYRHDARPPFTVNLPTELTADNFSYFGVDMPDREQGELDLSDICDILHLSAVYIGIIIKNITRGITTAYVSTTALNANNSDSWALPVVINNGSSIENGGAGQTISESDTIDVYLFLSTSAGETNWEAMTNIVHCLLPACTSTGDIRDIAIISRFSQVHIRMSWKQKTSLIGARHGTTRTATETYSLSERLLTRFQIRTQKLPLSSPAEVLHTIHCVPQSYRKAR